MQADESAAAPVCSNEKEAMSNEAVTHEVGGMEIFEMPGSPAPMYELPAREEIASELASPVPELASPSLELAAPALEREETSKDRENT
jgi:hypothetical protein